MGYAVYEHRAIPDRFAGYGVPATCDFPSCNVGIDRGMAYACGNSPDATCGRYFCGNHLQRASDAAYVEFAVTGEVIQHGLPADDDYTWPRCPRCANKDWTSPEYPVKPENEEWINHVLTDDSWAEWRGLHQNWEEEWRQVG